MGESGHQGIGGSIAATKPTRKMRPALTFHYPCRWIMKRKNENSCLYTKSCGCIHYPRCPWRARMSAVLRPVRLPLPPQVAKARLVPSPVCLYGVGHPALLDEPFLGLLASRNCPGRVLLDTLEEN